MVDFRNAIQERALAYDWIHYRGFAEFGDKQIVPPDSRRIALISEILPSFGGILSLGRSEGSIVPFALDKNQVPQILLRCDIGDTLTREVFLDNAPLDFSRYSIYSITDDWPICSPKHSGLACLDYRTITYSDPGVIAWRQVLPSNQTRRILLISSEASFNDIVYSPIQAPIADFLSGIRAHGNNNIVLRYCDVGQFVREQVWISWQGHVKPLSITEIYEI